MAVFDYYYLTPYLQRKDKEKKCKSQVEVYSSQGGLTWLHHRITELSSKLSVSVAVE